jgi:phosphate-selective porin OprO and OprP
MDTSYRDHRDNPQSGGQKLPGLGKFAGLSAAFRGQQMQSTNMSLVRLTTILLTATALSGLAMSPASAATKKKTTTTKTTKTTTTKPAQPDLRATVERQQAQIDALTAQINQMRSNAAPAIAANTQTSDENASKIEFMQASAEAQQAQIDALKKQAATNAPGWKGAPELKGNGFTFKPSGEIQYDFGYVSNPNNSIPGSTLGWNSIARRLLLGASGTLPGGFKYSATFNFAGGAVAYEDVIFSYAPVGSEFEATVGYMYPFNSMENMASNKNLSFNERAAFVDAYGEGRRLGGALSYTTPTWLIQTGLFNGQLNSNSNNTDWQFAARSAFYPQMLGGQLHFGAGYQYRQFLKSEQSNNYQARPYTQVTSTRFVATGALAAEGDQIIGLEAAGVWGPFHVASEAQWDKVRGINTTDPILTEGNASTGRRLASDPTFFAVYGEAGFWLTGETRGYAKGTWATTKILNPFDKGGWGGFQIVGRVDYLNLQNYVGGLNAGTAVVDGVVNGGKQLGYQLALNWWPTEYVRFSGQYSRAEITGGPLAAVVVPNSTTTDSVLDRRYGANVFTMRAQLSF